MAVNCQSLRSIILFSGFDDQALAAVSEVMSSREYPAQAIIFAQGEPSPGLWFIQHGRARLYRVSPQGREFTLCFARPGSLPCMGMCPLFDEDVSPAYAQAVEPTTVCFLERERALELAARQPKMAALYAQVLCNHYRHLTTVVAGLALHCVTSRLAEWLLHAADERGTKTERSIEVDLDVNQDVLASTLGATRQMVAQSLLKLERAGILSATGKHVTILDRGRLARTLR